MVFGLYGEIISELQRGDYRPQSRAKTMLYLPYTMISSVDLAHYRVSRATDWVSVDCGTTVKILKIGTP